MATMQKEKVKVGYPGLGWKMKMARIAVRPYLSQEHMAEKLGVSWMTVHRWEHDQRVLPYETLVGFAAACGVGVDVFLGGRG